MHSLRSAMPWSVIILHFTVNHWVLQPLPSASVDQGRGNYRTKLRHTTFLVWGTHELLSFALRYNKGLSIPELWIIHKQKGFHSSFQNGNSVAVVDTIINIVTNIQCCREQENKQHYECRLQLLLLPPTPLNDGIVIGQSIHIFHWYNPSNGDAVHCSPKGGMTGNSIATASHALLSHLSPHRKVMTTNKSLSVQSLQCSPNQHARDHSPSNGSSSGLRVSNIPLVGEHRRRRPSQERCK